MAVTKIRSSAQFFVDADLAVGSHKITGVTDPTAAQDAATKAYVDSKVQGVEWQDSVLDKDLLTPPGSPATGARYIINGTGTDAWATHDYAIAEWSGTAWLYTAAREGLATWVEDENIIYVCNGSLAWVKMTSVYSHNDLASIQGGAANDYYHLTSAQHTDLTDGNNCTSHVHTTYLLLTGGTMSGDITMGEDGHIGLTGAMIHFNGGGTAIEISNNVTMAEDATLGLSGATLTFNGSATSIDISNKLSVTNQITSTLANGTMPFVLTSSTMSTNLNADLLDGNHATAFFLTTGLVVRETPSGTKNGSNPTFTLANTPTAGTEQLYLNGILQNAGATEDYTITTNTITMATPPVATDVLLCTYWK
jgi:hypothetical protein